MEKRLNYFNYVIRGEESRVVLTGVIVTLFGRKYHKNKRTGYNIKTIRKMVYFL
jgi:hypothetical protein